MQQLTSDVTARLEPGTTLTDLFSALFPCGSVTGAPKSRSMSIIRSVEADPRGVYCGAVGFVAPPSEPVQARYSVAIRTAVVELATGRAVYGTGGGITWDSDPAREHAEMLVKTAALTMISTPFSLLETMLYETGLGLRNEQAHQERLASSVEQLGFRCDLRTIGSHLHDRPQGSPRSRVRLRLSHDGSVSIDIEPPPPTDGGVVLLGLDDDPVDGSDSRLRHKITDRRLYDSRADRYTQVDDVILTNTAGELTETTRANLVVNLDGRWWTPPLSSGCLPGVERGRLLEAGVIHERALRVPDLDDAVALAVVSSLRGWRVARLTPRGR